MDCFPQSRLGRSAEGMLTLVESQQKSAASYDPSEWEPTGEAFIFRLPNELIDPIIKHTAVNWESNTCTCSEYEHAWDSATLQALSLVCYGFKNIAQPLLYRNISFRWPIAMAPPSGSAIKLHRTLSRNPALRMQARILSVQISDIESPEQVEKYDILKDFATWLTRVRCLTISGGFAGDFHQIHTWGLIRTFSETMKDMTHIRLSREGRGLYLTHIIPNLSLFPKLKHLGVNGVSEWEEKKTGGDDIRRQRTAPIESISLSDYEECPQSTEALILWPKALTSFTLGSFYTNPHTMDYPMLETWLSVHRETLRRVSIGFLANTGSTRLFNATLFPNLESLKLSRWQQGRMWSTTEPFRFTADDANVLGPRVKCFGWDFNSNYYDEPWSAFGENEVAWVAALAETAIARKGPLKTIRIYFTPDIDGVSELDGYPWERMAHVRDTICKPNGIELCYKEPLSKSSWLALVKKLAEGENDFWTQASADWREAEVAAAEEAG